MPYDPTQLDEALYALAVLLNAGKASIDDDGKITIGDASHFLGAIIPVWKGIKDAQLALVDIAEMTPEQKDASKQKFLEALEFHPLDENAFDKALDALYTVLTLLIAFGVFKPVAQAPTEGSDSAPADQG